MTVTFPRDSSASGCDPVPTRVTPGPMLMPLKSKTAALPVAAPDSTPEKLTPPGPVSVSASVSAV
ncbi:MAG TPA: hypothetical protein VFW33_07450 [Gemmataceae bacterium]|nr:hypothetical protein [Gemmataceae bacterium]